MAKAFVIRLRKEPTKYAVNATTNNGQPFGELSEAVLYSDNVQALGDIAKRDRDIEEVVEVEVYVKKKRKSSKDFSSGAGFTDIDDSEDTDGD